MNALPWR
jgi:hypothetical protein